VTANALAELIERATGLALDRGGVSSTLDRVVSERLRALGLSKIEDYIVRAADPTGTEQRLLIDAITVPHTWFYRDPEQLEIMRQLLAGAPPGRLAVWVAGCATGEEAYTLAMIGRAIGREVTVLATDVNEAALASARRGVYTASAVRDVPDRERRWLVPHGNGFAVDDALREQVSFMRHNLVDPPPISPRPGWDLVVCRNVLIYFSPGAAVRVLQRFARAVREGGWVVVGASEVVFEPPPGLELVSSGHRLVLRRGGATRVAPPPPRPFATMLGAARPPAPSREPAPPVEPRRTAQALAAELAALAAPRAAPAQREDDLPTELARGHALFESGDISGAIPLYAELTRRHASIAEVWLFLGIAQYANGDLEPAAQALRASLCLDPSLWPAGFYLARALDRLGRHAEAIQQYDLMAVDRLAPLTLQSESAVINELRAFRHDFRVAARRVTTERAATSPGDRTPEDDGPLGSGKPRRSPTRA